jgi:hypothetical protein
MSHQLPDFFNVDKGTTFNFKLDLESGLALHSAETILRREYGFWIPKNHIVRRAVRLYLDHLKREAVDTIQELKEITKAIEGEPVT